MDLLIIEHPVTGAQVAVSAENYRTMNIAREGEPEATYQSRGWVPVRHESGAEYTPPVETAPAQAKKAGGK